MPGGQPLSRSGLPGRQLDIIMGRARCSTEREPLRQDHTTWTAVAPEQVFTVRTYATRAAYGPILVFKFHPNRNQNSSSTRRDDSRGQLLVFPASQCSKILLIRQ